MSSLDREDLETLAAGGRDIARVLKAIFDAYVEVGFTPDQALDLTKNWFRVTMGK